MDFFERRYYRSARAKSRRWSLWLYSKQPEDCRQSEHRARLEFCFPSCTIRRSACAIISIMPTYEYACQKCGQNFEAFQSMSSEPFQECPRELCRQKSWGHGRVKRLLGTGAGLIFKGSGFYTTDYRSSSYQEGAKKEAPTAKSDAGGEKPVPAKESNSSQAGATLPKTADVKQKKDPAG